MKIHRKCMALTIVEVLVALSIVLALAAISVAVLSKSRSLASNMTCITRFRILQDAVDVYRAEWGNSSAVVGSAGYLGLPHDPWKALYTLSTDVNERIELLSCPMISDQYKILTGVDWAGYGGRSLTYYQATEILRGETPLFIDPYHNPANLPYHNRGVHRFFIYSTLDSNIGSDFLVGIDVKPPPSGVSLDDWVKVKSR